MSGVSLVSLTLIGLAEARGKHLQYSKFANTNNTNIFFASPSPSRVRLSSRSGMLILYTPALLAGLASTFSPLLLAHQRKSLLLSSALFVHFLKRVLEVLFVHKYSGGMMLDSAILISLSYFLATVNAVYAQHFTHGLYNPIPPVVDLLLPGVVLFFIGISGNLYHHCLLAKLRNKDDDKGYKIPKGGFFSLVICPHYLFEIVEFVGIAFIAQTIFAFSFTFGTIAYLMGRSYATRKWYLSKFPNFPRQVKALFPFLF
ncbi:hypothetical protein ACLOJK_040841 [Asimina triloba]